MYVKGLDKEIYGITKEEAIQQGICIDCKKKATWYSPAGHKEYYISGLCEPCFDSIVGEAEIKRNGPHGSIVDSVLNGDHAQAAQALLERKGFADEWQVCIATDKMLMLDYDDRPYDGTLPEQFYVALGILESALGCAVYFMPAASKGGNTHVIVHLPAPMEVMERIAWQAAFGSDLKREALHILSIYKQELNPILLFIRKDQPCSGVDENGNSRVQCSHVERSTPQKLLTAGVPQMGDTDVIQDN